MKGTRGMVAGALTLAMATSALAGLPAEFNNRGSFDELRVTTATGRPLILKHADIGQGTIVADTTTVDFGSVMKLEKRTGSHAKAGGIWGGLAGCGLGVAAAMATKETETDRVGMFEVKTTTIQTWPIYFFALAGYLVGAALGSASHTYSTLYTAPRDSAGRSGGDLRLGLVPGSGGRSSPPCLALSYAF